MLTGIAILLLIVIFEWLGSLNYKKTAPKEIERLAKEAADKKLADVKIATEKITADKKIADAKVVADKVAIDKRLVDAKIAADKVAADQKLADAKIAAERATVDKKLADAKIAADEDYYKTYYKNDWRDFEKILREYNIKTLYHFTDSSNIASIKEHGGLYSWWSADEKGIFIPKSGGDDLSKNLDKRYNLQNYARLSFTKKHPMMYVAQKDGRIINPIVLKISPEIVFWKETMFSDRNATANKSSHGKEIDDFKRIKFDVVTKQSLFDILEIDKPYYQAEVMVREFIPICFILEGL